MRIVEFMGPYAAVPVLVRGDGGRERVIETLARSLSALDEVERVELIAQDGSELEGVLIHTVRFTRGLDPVRALSEARQGLAKPLDCDILHVHHPALLPAAEFIRARKVVLTHHGAITHTDNFRADGVTFVSQFLRKWMSQERPSDTAVRTAAIHNPVGKASLALRQGRRHGLGFMGALEKQVKRVDIALGLAERLNIPLFLAGPCSSRFLEQTVLPRLGSGVQYLGELSGESRRIFFEGVACMVCPNEAPEAFCLVAAEAMAVGTPVLGSRSGALPEVVEHGVSGYLCGSLDEYAEAYGRLDQLSPLSCAASAVRRFSPARIAGEYLAFFESVLRQVRP